MAKAAHLTVYDQVMIAALEVVSRPPLAASADLDLVVSILRDVIRNVSRDQERLLPLISTADEIVGYRPAQPGYYGGLHDRARKVMNAWDRQRVADGWDRIRGGGQ